MTWIWVRLASHAGIGKVRVGSHWRRCGAPRREVKLGTKIWSHSWKPGSCATQGFLTRSLITSTSIFTVFPNTQDPDTRKWYHTFDASLSLTRASHFSTLWGPCLLHKGELPRQATENVGPAGSRQEAEEGPQWSPTNLAGLRTVLLTHSNPLSFMFMHTCSSTFKLSELHVHTHLFFPLYPRHPGSGEPLGSANAFPNLRTDHSRQNGAPSPEASQYPLAVISKPTVFWSLAFLLLRPYKEHANSSVGAKNSSLGTHPCLTACGAHFRVRLPWILSLA